jgi:sugar/nucleoside kinase (ribokinase family)
MINAATTSADETLHFDVAGIGNALVDVLAQATDDFLAHHALTKGSMGLVSADRAAVLHSGLDSPVWTSGGSAANTMCGLAGLGASVAYIGKVADDDLGRSFGSDLTDAGVHFAGVTTSGSLPTGHCVIVVTPDAERTMSTYLGVSSLLTADDVNDLVVAQSAVLYMEGYLFDRPAAKAAFWAAANVAHRHGRVVSLTLSDSFCVERHRADFQDLVAGEIDVLFGNADEVISLFGTASLNDALDELRTHCPLAAVTAGASGSYVVTNDDVIHVHADTVTGVVDTTGAGDMYAAGFLYGLTRGVDPYQCARLGSLAAGQVIRQLGPRPQTPLAHLVAGHPDGHLVEAAVSQAI